MEEAFGYVNLDWQKHVQIDPRYFRPVEVSLLQADAREAKKQLGWEAQVKFRELVRIMVDADIAADGSQSLQGKNKFTADNRLSWLRRA